MNKRLEGMSHLVADEFKKWIVKSLFIGLTAVLVFIFTPLYENMTSLWGVPDRLLAIEKDIQELRNTTRTLTGEDRIIRQARGLSYVKEPVYKGDNITLVLVLSRTANGASCTVQSGQPLLVDENRIPTPGSFPKYTRKRNLTQESVPVSLEIIPPPNLKPGRVEVYIVLEYDCDGTTRFDRTDTITFELLPKP